MAFLGIQDFLVRSPVQTKKKAIVTCKSFVLLNAEFTEGASSTVLMTEVVQSLCFLACISVCYFKKFLLMFCSVDISLGSIQCSMSPRMHRFSHKTGWLRPIKFRRSPSHILRAAAQEIAKRRLHWEFTRSRWLLWLVSDGCLWFCRLPILDDVDLTLCGTLPMTRLLTLRSVFWKLTLDSALVLMKVMNLWILYLEVFVARLLCLFVHNLFSFRPYVLVQKRGGRTCV